MCKLSVSIKRSRWAHYLVAIGLHVFFPWHTTMAQDDKNYFPYQIYELDGRQWVPRMYDPASVCDAYAQAWGWNVPPKSYSFHQDLPGRWRCQRWYDGVIEPSQYTWIVGACQVDPAPIKTGSYWSHPYPDEQVGQCYCSSNKYFDPGVEWCNYDPEGSFSVVDDGMWESLGDQLGAGEPNACTGNPINILTGGKFQREVDYIKTREPRFQFEHFYNSTLSTWQFSYSASIDFVSENGAPIALYRAEDGKVIRLYPDNTGAYKSVDGRMILVNSSSSSNYDYTLTTSRRMEAFDGEGKLSRIVYSDGYLVNLSRISAEEVLISDNQGSEMTVFYSSTIPGQVFRLSAPRRDLRYDWSNDYPNLLVEIREYDSSTEQEVLIQEYLYENVSFPEHLTGIVDANNARYATWAYDDEGRATMSSHHGGAEQVSLDYEFMSDPVDPRVTVTNSKGKRTTYHFTMMNGTRKVTLVEGHPSASCAAANKMYTYYDNALLQTKTDWKSNVTRYHYNDRGLEVTRIEAEGTPEERIITTEWHPTFNLRTKTIAPGKETVFSYDTEGRLLGRTINALPLN